MRLQSISSMLLADKVVLVMIVLTICNLPTAHEHYL